MVKFVLNRATTCDPVTKWTARWVWLNRDDKGPDSIIYARKEVSLPDKVTEALIHITADSKYELFINGKRIGRGPARCDFRFQLYDTYDITPFLHSGSNVIGVLVIHYGYGTGWAMGKKAGLLVQGSIKKERGKEICFDTPDGWKLKRSECWPKKMIRRWQKHPPRGESLGAVEVYDSRLEPTGWMKPGFDDADWVPPVVLRDNGGEIPPVAPWTHLEPRPIPFMKEQSVLPQQIVRIGDTEAKILEYDVAIQMSAI